MADTEKNKLQTAVNIGQILFFIIIAGATLWNVYLIERQTNLFFRPVIGVVDIKKVRLHSPGTEDTYENIKGARITFVIENIGTLPAKNCKTDLRGKLGNVLLSVRQRWGENSEGVVIIPGAKNSINATLSKKTIDTLTEKKERLFYTISFSFSDWEEYQTYSYSTFYEVSVS